MNRAISNIAWPDDVKLADISSILHRHGITGIECAPLKMKHDCGVDCTFKEMKHIYNDFGFCIPAFQAILFGHNELQVFDESTHAAFLEHIKLISSFAEDAGAHVLVFGAPKNKVHHSTLLDGALDVACSFFRKAGDVVRDFGCIIGIEANPREYNCNFLTTTEEARRFVKMVDSPYVALHIDTGTIEVNHENFRREVSNCDFCHFHLSAPFLKNIADSSFDNYAAVELLDEIRYGDWISIEMKKPENLVDYKMHIERALSSAFGRVEE